MKMESAVMNAAQRYSVSRATVLRAWKKYRRDLLVRLSIK
jgi:hypothetical protein